MNKDMRSTLLNWLVQNNPAREHLKSKLDFDSNLFEAGLLSSLKIIEFVVFIESQIHQKINLSNLKIEDFHTINNIQKVIDNQIDR